MRLVLVREIEASTSRGRCGADSGRRVAERADRWDGGQSSGARAMRCKENTPALSTEAAKNNDGWHAGKRGRFACGAAVVNAMTSWLGSACCSVPSRAR